ncbi:hypothetical protein N0V93_007851 [Gnomoniopsis smithogilvyi]|uniref:AA1-like domain-containing protein n=1 Tax=Gnomoniopsis smithogilvyi TaxID=1191159 RepID=A0A9W8YKX9_9PEZI|nr:hypothetical protein N0V93_007851 [Gnomoniopsis smithogilvyi]
MRFLAAATTTALLSVTALAAPTPCTPEGEDSTVYEIQDFTLRKYDGQNVATLSFNILATNGGTLDFECSPYDPVTNTATQAFESDNVYSCGKNSLFSFSYDVSSTELFLWQEITTDNTIGGSIKTGDPICRAGGSSASDLVCTVPDIVKLDVTLTKL